jgi:elongation factor P
MNGGEGALSPRLRIASRRGGSGGDRFEAILTLAGEPPSLVDECVSGAEAPMLTTADFKKGLRILVDGEPFLIMEHTVQSPSARGSATLVKARVRNLLSGSVFDRTFRAGERFESPDIVRREIQFLYRDGEDLHFMDNESYDQFSLSVEQVGDDAGWLTDGLNLHSVLFNGEVVNVEIPRQLEVEVLETQPAVRGNTAAGKVLKEATVAGGVVIKVPLYLEAGERIQVDTEDRRFVRRC